MGWGQRETRDRSTLSGGVLAALCLAACDPGVIAIEEDTRASDTGADVADATPDTSGDAPDTLATDADIDTTPPPIPTEAAALTRVIDAPALGIVPLPDGALVVGDTADWWWIDAAGAHLVEVEPGLAPIDAPPIGAARVDTPLGPVTLLASGTRLYLADAGVLRDTPLADLLASEILYALRSPSPDVVWIASHQHLWRLRGEHLAYVTPGALPTSVAQLALGQRGGEPALWVAAGGAVYALTGDEALEAWPERSDLAAHALATDAAGRVWVVDQAAALHVRTPDGVWRDMPVEGEPLHFVSAHPASQDVWVFGQDHLYHVVGDELRVVTNGRLYDGHTFPVTTADGRVLVADATGVDELAPGRVVALLGFVPDARLAEPTTVTLRATDPVTVASATLTLDGAPLNAVASGAGDARVWTATLDPVVIANGAHEVAASIIYEDGLTLAARLPFEVEFATWHEDVEPVYARRCATCHDAVTGASSAVLDTPGSWSSRIDCIVCRVADPYDPSRAECLVCDDITSSMPPTGPIAPDAVELIREWRAGGFRLE